MTIGTKLYTKLFGLLVGKDKFGNSYYTGKRTDSFGRKKRWVIYKGKNDPTIVPPAWHGWLHYTTDKILNDNYAWQKDAMPNQTGTKNAYLPKGHVLKGGHRAKATGDYQAWRPE